MWEKIKVAWGQAYENIKAPWKEGWEQFKDAVVTFMYALGNFIWGAISLTFNLLWTFIKTVGIILLGWLVDWIKGW